MNIIKTRTLAGQPIEFVDEIIGAGRMKDVYFSPDKSYVVALFRDHQDAQTRERLAMITGRFRDSIFNQAGGDYWKDLFCWPTQVVEHAGKIGVVAPAYQKHFFFEHGSRNHDALNIRGRDKEGKWFASAHHQNRSLDPRERGDWSSYLRICLLVSRAVRRLHAAGLAHSDLSYKNVLLDPVSGRACIIDLDGLVVPGKYPPEVVGTPDFIAPEVVMSAHLDKADPRRKLPCIATDQHALAVLIYMYLLYRHPLRGDQIHAMEAQQDEELAMGAHALFVEHPLDARNRIDLAQRRPSDLPWADTGKIPYTVTGPHLQPLFERAFMQGLHEPAQRPSADSWEQALIKTLDLILPCTNPACEQKWFVFDNSMTPKCPFCGTPYQGSLPVLNLYFSRQEGQFKPENHRLMVYAGQSLFQWHVHRNMHPNEKLGYRQKQRVGYFSLHDGGWWLVNQGMSGLTDLASRQIIPVGDKIQLVDGQQLLLSREEGGRLVVVQMVESR